MSADVEATIHSQLPFRSAAGFAQLAVDPPLSFQHRPQVLSGTRLACGQSRRVPEQGRHPEG